MYALDVALPEEEAEVDPPPLLWRFDANIATDDIVSIQSVMVLKNTVIVVTSGGHIIAIAGN